MSDFLQTVRERVEADVSEPWQLGGWPNRTGNKSGLFLGFRVVNLGTRASGRCYRLEWVAGEVHSRDEVCHSGFGTAEARISRDLRGRSAHPQVTSRTICGGS